MAGIDLYVSISEVVCCASLLARPGLGDCTASGAAARLTRCGRDAHDEFLSLERQIDSAPDPAGSVGEGVAGDSAAGSKRVVVSSSVISGGAGIITYDKLRWANWRAKAVLPLGIGALLLFFLPASASAASSSSTTCVGTLAPGTYHSLVVPAGQTCDLGVGPVRVLAGVQVGPGATFMLGFELGPATGTITGGLVADNAAQVQVHNARITGGVTIQGGFGAFGCAQPVPQLCFTDLEDNSISGGATIDGYNGFFLGFIRNHVNGSVAISNNLQTFDQLDIGSNVINGNLTCAGNNPTENTGDSPGPAPDTVTGHNTCHEVA